MLAMKNLDFQTDKNTSFLELDPPEDQEHLMMCLMLCQQKIQNPGDGIVYSIDRIPKNVEDKGLCFQKRVFNID